MTIQYEFEELLNSQEAADLLGVCKVTVQRWVRARKITPLKIGRKYRFRASELDKWIKRESK